ncbi:hypothetical protein BH09BAC4_BH09BAC4_24690 [soil metagenome]
MKIITGILLALSLLAGSCQSKTKEHSHPDGTTNAAGPVAELEKQVLATHDSVMTQMSELMRLKKVVSAQLEKVKDAAARKQGLIVRAQLEGADQLMMDWMHEYNGDTLKKLDQTQGLVYLKDQQTKVNTVREAMRKSLADAKQYVD